MIKETQGKLPVQEIDWEFIKEMMEVMLVNKSKYPPENWKQKMDNPKELLYAAQRHFLELLVDNPIDSEDGYKHSLKVCLNLMMYNYQLEKFPF